MHEGTPRASEQSPARRRRAMVLLALMALGLVAGACSADAARGDEHAIAGDVSTLEWIRNRIPLDDAAASGVDDELRYLDAASEAGELKAAASAAARLRDALATVLPAA